MELWLVFAIVGIALFLASGVNVWNTRKGLKEMEARNKRFVEFTEFYDWGTNTIVVVRDKENHADARRQSVWGMFQTFREGGAFEGAMMLFQNTEFKVYVKGPKGE